MYKIFSLSDEILEKLISSFNIAYMFNERWKMLLSNKNLYKFFLIYFYDIAEHILTNLIDLRYTFGSLS